MRLLHTITHTFTEFYDTEIPPYAILSHRWGSDEVTFKDFKTIKKWFGGSKSEGLSKIQRSCSLAKLRGLNWIWIDTCCIDKRSSAELTEAINSMYRWYELATDCYAYLNDVTWAKSGTKDDMERSRQEFIDSKWFTRGWTLQELLAPKQVIFYDRNWAPIGLRSKNRFEDSELTAAISRTTSISAKYLRTDSPEFVPTACIAEKMSWVSRRKTSRSEDMAYCMLGLFNVNMPLLYGEGGEKAFLRLQYEIIKQSGDESIFAWATKQPPFPRYIDNVSGIFAPTPLCFADSGSVQRFDSMQRPPWSMTNKGLAIHIPGSDIDGKGNARLKLNCGVSVGGQSAQKSITINLLELPPRNSNLYYRASYREWAQDETKAWAAGNKSDTCIFIIGTWD